MQDISDCLSPEAQNVAEARLAAKRAARAEAREIRMKELERQQKEVEERSEKDFAEKSGRPVSGLSAATLASLGGTSSRRGSGDTSISVDTEASIREIKDSLAEVEEKYKRSMVTNAQLDNEKTSLQYQVDTLREVLLEMEEEVAESRRQHEDKQKECERQKHEQGVLRFQLAEMKEALEQREALMTALERQKEFFDPVRSERDALRDEVTQLREALKKHGIVLDSDGTLNGDTSIENHVNSDGPPDPPVRAVSMEIRLKKLMDEREFFLEQIKKLKGQLEEKSPRNKSPENPDHENMENGTDGQRDANRQINDLKFKLTKSTQEITALEQNIIRLESQLTRFKSSAENAEKVEDELKAEKRRLQRELRAALDKIEELEVGNSHLIKRLEKMKANRSAILSQQ